MKKLLAMIVGLLVAGPALGVSIKGRVDHIAGGATHATLPTCNASTEGYRVYNTDTATLVICDSAFYIESGPTTYGEPTFIDGTPTISFDDTTAVTGVAGTINASIYANCVTLTDCDLALAVNSGAAALTEMLGILTETGGASTVYLGRNVAVGTAWANTQTYAAVQEGGDFDINNTAPQINFMDSDMAGTEDDNARILAGCATGTTAGGDEDCDMDFLVQAGGTLESAILIDGVAAGDYDIQIGDPGTAYIGVDQAGVLTAIGATAYVDESAIQDHEKIVSFYGGLLSADGAQCAQPTIEAINGSVHQSVICTDNDASTLYAEMTMPDNWDGGTFTFLIDTVHVNANPADNLHADVSVMCRGATAEMEGTFGTEVGADIETYNDQWDIESVEVGPVTPNCTGGCTIRDRCVFKWQMDAGGTTTAVADLRILGITISYLTEGLDEVN